MERYEKLLIYVILTVLVFCVYLQVTEYKFVNYDDRQYVAQNPAVQRGLTKDLVKWAFTKYHAGNWHPVTWISHAIDCQLFGLDPSGHHLVAVIFHAVNSVLMLIMLNRLTGRFWAAAFAAGLFALHPLHVESVAWVAERKDLLSMFFWLLTMIAYISYARRQTVLRYLLSIFFFALGLMAKPMVVTLPFVLLLLDFWPLERIRFKEGSILPIAKTLKKPLLEKVPFVYLTIASCIVTFIVQRAGGAVIKTEAIPVFSRIANTPLSYLTYIFKMFWPVDLAMFYMHPAGGVPFGRAAVYAVILIAITWAVFHFAKKYRYLPIGWLWYLGTLIPVIGLVQVGNQALADRYTYIPLTGLFLIIAMLAQDLTVKLKYRKAILGITAVFVLSILSFLTWRQCGYWKDTITLCRHAIEVTENNYIAHFCMTEELRASGDIDGAIYHNSESVRIKPDYIEAHNGLGLSYLAKGELKKAEESIRHAISLNPQMYEPRTNLGVVLLQQGRYAEAIEQYKIALKTADLPQLRRNIGYAYTITGENGKAIENLAAAIRAEPANPESYTLIAGPLYALGRIDQAIANLRKSIELNPDQPRIKESLDKLVNEYNKQRSNLPPVNIGLNN